MNGNFNHILFVDLQIGDNVRAYNLNDRRKGKC